MIIIDDYSLDVVPHRVGHGCLLEMRLLASTEHGSEDISFSMLVFDTSSPPTLHLSDSARHTTME